MNFFALRSRRSHGVGRWLATALALTALPGMACSQTPSDKSLPAPPARVCDASLRVVAIRVVDSAGNAVNDARIEVRRVKGNVLVLSKTGAMSTTGDYVLFDDQSAPATAKGGEAFRLTAVAGRRRASAILVIGRAEPDGCHVEVLKGEQKLVVR